MSISYQLIVQMLLDKYTITIIFWTRIYILQQAYSYFLIKNELMRQEYVCLLVLGGLWSLCFAPFF